MSVFSISTYAQSLARSTKFKLYIPDDVPPIMTQGNPHFDRPVKTLFLLHGFSGNDLDWTLQSKAMAMALAYNLAIVFPNGENSFYLNRAATGCQYATLVGEELPAYLRRAFGLCQKREDTYIGGLSMGGFGAMHTALAYPDTFSRAFSLSGALIVHNVAEMKPGHKDFMANYEYYREVFGEPAEVLASRNNPETLVKELQAAGREIPGMYLACGTEDPLYNENQIFRRFLAEQNAPFTYREGPGVHDFRFWNTWLEPAVRWMLDLPEEAAQ